MYTHIYTCVYTLIYNRLCPLHDLFCISNSFNLHIFKSEFEPICDARLHPLLWLLIIVTVIKLLLSVDRPLLTSTRHRKQPLFFLFSLFLLPPSLRSVLLCCPRQRHSKQITHKPTLCVCVCVCVCPVVAVSTQPG